MRRKISPKFHVKNDANFTLLGRSADLILLQKYRDTNGRRIVIQIGGVYTTFCQEEGILLQKYRDRNGRCIAILFKSIGVRGRCDSPDIRSRKATQRSNKGSGQGSGEGFSELKVTLLR